MSHPEAIAGNEARELLFDLVSIPSPSGEEAEAAATLRSFFERNDRDAWIDEVGNVRAPADDAVLLTSHIDTVEGQLPVHVTDSPPTLWGRGSVDATGPLAAMAMAAVSTGASFVGVVGEERDSRGAYHLIKDREPPETIINGEPSGWASLVLGYYGMLSGTIAFEDERTHHARPEPNPIDHATTWWERTKREVKSSFETDGSIILTPTEIDGGTSSDGRSFEATLAFQCRIPPEVSLSSVKEHITEAADRGHLTWRGEIPPQLESARSRPATAVRSAIRAADGDPTHLIKTGTSDANIYADTWDCPVITYGPGDSDLDHSPDEHLELAEFDRAVEVLVDAANRLCGDD